MPELDTGQANEIPSTLSPGTAPLAAAVPLPDISGENLLTVPPIREIPAGAKPWRAEADALLRTLRGAFDENCTPWQSAWVW